jgi:hypothetical protein
MSLLEPSSSTKTNSTVPIIVGVMVPSIVIILSLLVYIIISNRRARKRQDNLELMMTNSHQSGSSSYRSSVIDRNSISITPRSSVYLKNLDSPYTQLLADIKIQRQLGGGQFGQVYKGVWQDTTDVALKKLKSEGIEDFKKEVNTLKYTPLCRLH